MYSGGKIWFSCHKSLQRKCTYSFRFAAINWNCESGRTNTFAGESSRRTSVGDLGRINRNAEIMLSLSGMEGDSGLVQASRGSCGIWAADNRLIPAALSSFSQWALISEPLMWKLTRGSERLSARLWWSHCLTAVGWLHRVSAQQLEM